MADGRRCLCPSRRVHQLKLLSPSPNLVIIWREGPLPGGPHRWSNHGATTARSVDVDAGLRSDGPRGTSSPPIFSSRSRHAVAATVVAASALAARRYTLARAIAQRHAVRPRPRRDDILQPSPERPTKLSPPLMYYQASPAPKIRLMFQVITRARKRVEGPC